MSLIFQSSGKIFDGNFKRIVSVVPSQTELLFDLGLDEEVVGITKFCVHPEAWFRNKTRVGGTKQLHLDKIIALKPDLVLANKEENLQIEIEQLSMQTNVWVSEIENLNDALDMIKQVGRMCNAISASEKMINHIAKSFAVPAAKLHSAIYLIWNEPMMTIGGDTFISDMMLRFGYRNLFAHQSRYPNITTEKLIA